MISSKHLVRKIGQAGFTALELIVVLIVGVSIIAFAANKMASVFGASAIAEESDNVAVIMAGVRQINDAGSYLQANGAIPTPVQLQTTLIAISAAPRAMVATPATLRNRWGGAVTLAPAANTYGISYAGVPVDDCIKLTNKVSMMTSVLAVTINGAAIGAVGAVPPTIPVPLAAAAAPGACANIAAGNVIVWTVKI